MGPRKVPSRLMERSFNERPARPSRMLRSVRVNGGTGMIDMRKTLHVARFAAILAAALAISACAKNAEDAQANAAGQATPGSQQDFVVNVGDRVFFETDSSELTPQARATLDKQAQWLTNYSQLRLHHRGPCRRARHARIQHRARRAARPGGARLSGLARHPGAAHAHDLLRQGAAGRGLQRHLVLVAEPPRRHRARCQFIALLGEMSGGGTAALRAAVLLLHRTSSV